MTPRAERLIKGLTDDRGEPPSRMFEEWIDTMYTALAAAAEPSGPWEDRYRREASRRGRARLTRFAELLALLVEELTANGGRDVLGAIATDDRVRAVNPAAGQFFTPPDVARMMAAITFHDAAHLLTTQPYLTIAEPACGAGVMLLETLRELKDRGIDPHRQVWIDATDVSRTCVAMTYVQLALVGAAGVVRHGDTLRLDTWEITRLPLTYLFEVAHGTPGGRIEIEPLLPEVEPAPAPPPPVAEAPFALTGEPVRRRAVQSRLFGD